MIISKNYGKILKNPCFILWGPFVIEKNFVLYNTSHSIEFNVSCPILVPFHPRH